MRRAPFQVLIFPYRQVGDGQIAYALLKRAECGFWQPIAGGGEGTETIFEAARRETLEETGISPDAALLRLQTVEPIPVNEFKNSSQWGEDLYVIPQHCFGVQAPGSELTISQEHSEYRWMSFSEAFHMLHFDGNRTALWELDCRLRGVSPHATAPPAEDLPAAHLSARCRVRELGIIPGILPIGPLNTITDVVGVRVGHLTLIQDEDIRSGVTAILPHSGNLFQERVPAGFACANGFGKFMGSTQVQELGELETPILLTNTLSVPQAAEAILDWTLEQPGNEQVYSINPVVGETNDSFLNDIRQRALTAAHARQAIESATSGPVAEGTVGAGTGSMTFGWKGGIGTSSRQLPNALGGWTLGALVQSNFGGVLQIDGLPVGKTLGKYYLKDQLEPQSAAGSIIIILATDAPLSDRNLTRLAGRAFAGMARTGASFSDGSGDYALAFSTAEAVRRTPAQRNQPAILTELPNSLVSPLFQAAIEATEEAIYNSLCKATALSGTQGHTAEALPLDQVRALLQRQREI